VLPVCNFSLVSSKNDTDFKTIYDAC